MARAGLIALSFAALVASTPALAEAPAIKLAAAPSPVAKTDTEAPAAQALSIQIAPEQKPSEPGTKSDNSEAAVVPAVPAPLPITLVAKVDLTAQKIVVMEYGKAKYTWAISSGARGYDTPKGNFQPGWMAKVWFSKQYDNAPMPHAVFFKDGAAIHATQAVGSLGRPASHGCVRLAPANAATFYALVARHGLKQTRVNVFGVPRHGPEAIASRRAPQPVYQRVAYAPSYGGYNGYNAYSGYGGGYGGSYNGGYPGGYSGSAFGYKPQAVRVVPYGTRVSRY